MSGQESLFEEPAARRDRIAAAIARRFPCYGVGSQSAPRNPIAVTLEAQPLQFAFGVHVADVVVAVLELAEGG